MNSGKRIERFFVFLITLVLIASSVSLLVHAGETESDDVYDICHINAENEQQCNLSAPSIDIVKVGSSYADGNLQLLMAVNGQIEISEETQYTMSFNTSSNNSLYRYVMNYSNGQHAVWMFSPDGTKSVINTDVMVSSDKHILSTSIPDAMVLTNKDISGVAITQNESGTWFDEIGTSSELDTQPFNGTAPSDLPNSGDQDEPTGSMPGFTIGGLILGLFLLVAVVLKRKH